MQFATSTSVTMQYGLSEFAAKRRKIRKGTHSCQECRRRKVKCVYATPYNTICIVCERRGAQCISQTDLSVSEDLFDESGYARVQNDAADQAIVKNLLADNTGVPRNNESRPLLDNSPTSEPAIVSVPSAPGSNKGEGGHSYSIINDVVPPELQAHAAIREALLRALPSKTDISILFERLSIVSAICYQSDYKAHTSDSDKVLKQQIRVKSLQHPEKHPTLLARQMLLFAAAVQHLSPNEVIAGLTEHHTVIMKGLAESAIKLVNMDDALLGTLDGLENLVFEIFYHIDCGNIRRAWITTRRAVTVAQMLGLHRPGHHRFTLIEDESDLEPEVIWSTIVSMERMLSLLLGLPTSTSHMILACQKITNEATLGHNLSALVGSLAAKILERNQIESAQQALDMTGEIDREIVLAAEQMPSVFWRPLAFVGLEKDSLKALTETRRAFGHMCYYSMVVQLHLPYMLSPHNASQRLYSKIACINASREILTGQIELRTCNPLSASCRMSDFLSLVAGMALMLGYITSHGGDESDRLLVHQRLGDRATVERVLDCIDAVSDLHEDVLAVRCAALLKDLLAIERDAAQQRSFCGSQPHEMNHNLRNKRDVLIVRVPYLGSLRISQEGVAALPAARMQQVQSLSEGVTIGGIGSMLIRGPQLTGSGENYGTGSTAVLPTASTRVTYDPSQNSFTAHNVPVISTDSPKQSDLMFPDAIASFDDWAFQGVDTAFMETLMRGSAVLLPDEPGFEMWDVSTFP